MATLTEKTLSRVMLERDSLKQINVELLETCKIALKFSDTKYKSGDEEDLCNKLQTVISKAEGNI